MVLKYGLASTLRFIKKHLNKLIMEEKISIRSAIDWTLLPFLFYSGISYIILMK